MSRTTTPVKLLVAVPILLAAGSTAQALTITTPEENDSFQKSMSIPVHGAAAPNSMVVIVFRDSMGNQVSNAVTVSADDDGNYSGSLAPPSGQNPYWPVGAAKVEVSQNNPSAGPVSVNITITN
jgi:hypothetical protein